MAKSLALVTLGLLAQLWPFADFATVETFTARMKGMGSLVLVPEADESVTFSISWPMGRVARGVVAFDGWQLMVTPIPWHRPFLDYLVRDCVDGGELENLDCGSARLALNSIEMRPVAANVRIGPVMAIRK